MSQKPLYLIGIVIVLILAIGGGLYILVGSKWKSANGTNTQSSSSTHSSSALPQQSELPVINANSQTASKYFAGKGNAIDFRDGAEGDFSMSITKQGDKIAVNYDKTIKGSTVRVWDLGRLDVLTDHKVIFAAQPPLPTTQPRATPGPVPAQIIPTVFLPNPYTIGDMPQGFQFGAVNFIIPSPQPNQPLFQTGKRYSIEIDGYDANNKLKMASYTFTD